MSRRRSTFVAVTEGFGLRHGRARSGPRQGGRCGHHPRRDVVLMENLAIGRFDSDGVRDRKMVQQWSRRSADRRGETRLIVRREGRNQADIHKLALAFCN